MTKIVNEDSFTIGRSVDCAISLTEDSISRVHLTVYRRQDQVWIEDKGSSNGTFVNGARIANNTLVNVLPADKIRIGKSDYIVSLNLDLKDEEVSDIMKAESTEFMQHPLVAEKLVARKIEKPDIDKKIEQQNFEKSGILKAPERIIATVDKSADRTSMRLEKSVAEALVPKIELKLDLKAPLAPRNEHKESAPVDEAKKVAETARLAALKNEAERLVHEAHKKSAQIIYQGEMQAEKRVQAIYTQAQDRQAEADVYYQEKISAAHKEADAVIINFQSMGQELITQARHMAQELRDEVDLYVDNMREKTRREVDHIIANARHEAETVKKEAFEKAINKAELEAADYVASSKAEAADLLGFAKMQSEELLEKARVEIEKDLKDLRSQIDAKQKHVQDLKREEEEFQIRSQGELEDHDARMTNLSSTFKTLQDELIVAQKDLAGIRAQESTSHEEIKRQEQMGENLKKANQLLLQERSALESKLKELQGQMGHFSLDIQATEEKRRQMEQDIHQQKAQLKDRLERDRMQIIKDSEERVNEAQLDMGKRLQKLERELFDEIVSRKDKLVKEIIVIVETRIAKVLEPAKWDQVSSVIFDGVQAAIEGRAVSFTDVGAKPKHSQSLERKKKKEHMRWLATGLVCGLALTFGSLKIQSIMNQDKNPMRTIANEDARRRQEELDKRKFNPVQTPELKDSYTEAVIYTKDFVDSFQETEFQKKLYKAASAYLLKTWRVDEDKSIQVLSMSSALVKELNEKRQTIHPDFVKDGIQKMHALEKQSMERMKNVLGSEVRLESYRRFERKFYETEILKR
ncbi:MAG: FHA domain-containing protein [Bdellovibrionaceae bacterium]|nr:FHA domain-containing protein [Pseudobdellovibrionaceae bacterium]